MVTKVNLHAQFLHDDGNMSAGARIAFAVQAFDIAK